MALLQAMYRDWPFFRTLLSNMDMVLAKSDIAIASRYAELVADATLRERDLLPHCARNGNASSSALLTITGQNSLLEGNPLLARSIRNRFPYLDPLNHMQVELLRRYRGGDDRRRGRHRHPPDDQRHRRRLAQQRMNSYSTAARSGASRRSSKRACASLISARVGRLASLPRR